MLAVRDLIDKADLAGADLVGSSVGGSFAAEVAAIWPDKVARLALIAPFGLFDEKDPATDPWAQKQDDIAGLMTAQPDTYKKLKEMPAGANSIEWPIEQTRAAEAAARIFWPLGNTRLERRLPLIIGADPDPVGRARSIAAEELRPHHRRRHQGADRSAHHRRRGPPGGARQARGDCRRDPRLHALTAAPMTLVRGDQT